MKNIDQETMFLLKKYHLTANKSLGQNFLINEEVVHQTVEAANVTKEDLIIEIGPGLGTLTQFLLERAKKVIAIELDNKMVNILKERFYLYSNFEIIQQDVLKVNLKELIETEKEKNNIQQVKIVANLPYYITTPIIMKLLEDKLPIQTITVMVQKEVADRLVAKPGEKLAGAITYSVNYYAETKKIIDVAKESFIPEPEVTSSVIQFVLRKAPPVEVKNEKLFFELIKSSFMQRRKTFLNGIANSRLASKETLKQILRECKIDENARGESFTLEQFAQITNKLILS